MLEKSSLPKSDHTPSRRWLHGCLMALCVLAVGSVASVAGQVSTGQARKLIATMPGLQLKPKAVHVRAVQSSDAGTIEARAEIAMAFRLQQNDAGQWRVAEFRTGQDHWQRLDFILDALKVTEGANPNPCDISASAATKQTAFDLTSKQARCLLGDLLGVTPSSDDVRIKSVSSITIPLSSKPSAMVESLVTAEFRFQKQPGGSWGVSSLRTGDRDWVDSGAILSSVNLAKTAAARAELETLSRALEDFRAQRGTYVEAKSEAVLVDFLSPRYLSRVIRLDPWHHPYLYEGTRDRFALSSVGPDGKANTSDDIVLNGPVRPAGL